MEGSDKSTTESSGKHLVYFAAERTHLAWMRVALALMGLGFIVDRFGLFLRHAVPEAASDRFSLWTGAGLIVLGVLVNLLAAVRYALFASRYCREGRTEPGSGLFLSICVSVLIGMLGIVIIVLLIRITN